MNVYIGHEHQIYGVEEMRLVGGKADGMRILQVRNGSGLEFTVSLDRCADISRLSLNGVNYGFFSSCGYVSPKYYDGRGDGFLKSFTGGFLTTCGLSNVGKACTDEGVEYPLHGTISNTPAEDVRYWIENDEIHIKATMRDASLFSYKLILEREYVSPLFKNELHVKDTVKNIGSQETPIQILYHCNVGYPILSENTVLSIPAVKITPRNEHAAADIDNCFKMEKPQPDYEECCYFHTMDSDPEISVYNPDLKKGFSMSYDSSALSYFTEWKMMGEQDYVLGVEPGNTLPDGRAYMRENGLLEYIKPGEEKNYALNFKFTEDK